MNLAIFDFDGTISTKDSFLDFIWFAVGPIRFIVGVALWTPMIIFHMLVTKRGRAKELAIEHFFKGWEVSRFRQIAKEYVAQKLPRIIRPGAMEKIAWHRQNGHKIVVVTASIDAYLTFWCQDQEVDLIATQLEEKDGRLTGKLFGNNCHGVEKVRRVKEAYDISRFDKIYAYGDSPADRALTIIAHQFEYKPFE